MDADARSHGPRWSAASGPPPASAGRNGSREAEEQAAVETPPPEAAPPPEAPPPPMTQADQVEALKNLKELLDSGVLTQEEFDQQKQKILNG